MRTAEARLLSGLPNATAIQPINSASKTEEPGAAPGRGARRSDVRGEADFISLSERVRLPPLRLSRCKSVVDGSVRNGEAGGANPLISTQGGTTNNYEVLRIA